MASEWLEDAFGPDQVRVTFCVEPAVERLVRERDAWTAPRYGLLGNPVGNAVRALLPRLVQTRLLHGRWAVVIEADSGTRRRLIRSSRDEALAAAGAAQQRVRADGVAALSSLT